MPLIGPTPTGTAPVVVPRWDSARRPVQIPAAPVTPPSVRPTPVPQPPVAPATVAKTPIAQAPPRRPTYVPALGCDLLTPVEPHGGPARDAAVDACQPAGTPHAARGAGQVAAIPGYSANFVGFPVGRTPPGVDTSRLVRLDTPTSAPLLDFQNRQTDKQLLLLANLPNQPGYPSLVPRRPTAALGAGGGDEHPQQIRLSRPVSD